METLRWCSNYLMLILLMNLYCYVNCTKRQHLNKNWTVKNENNSIDVPAKVPGGIYSNLQTAGVIGDIYYRYNDVEYRWIGNETWIYSNSFQVDKMYLRQKYINLVFKGLDTFSMIYLNGNYIGSSDNMFLRYAFDVKEHIKEGNNNLTIVFSSPIRESQKLFDEQSKKYVVPPACVPKEYNGECHVNHIRKMQASFSWDWGPAFPSVGIWKPVFIEYSDSAVLRDVSVNISTKDDNWVINITSYLETNTQNTTIAGLITAKLITDFNVISSFSTVNGYTNDAGEYSQETTIVIPKLHVGLWWPNGYGKQQLYKLKLIFKATGQEDMTIKNIKIGFRTIQLVQNPISNGLSFYFKVNNVAIFAKGSNWIPANILPEKGTNVEDIKFLLKSAKNTHMNMLRVWGGGVYESDVFYKTADEFGILIWQDFMFACSMYPVNEEFLKSVKTEVKQQVRRLQHHTSIAVWAGNNENEAALRGNWYTTQGNFSIYKEDYVKLYVNTIRESCLSNDKTRSFVVSSPSNGLQSEKEGYVAQNPYDNHFGDVHYYNYFLDGWNQNIYPKTRFASEYGYQSIPSIYTMEQSTNISADLKYDSDFLNHRQHHPAGYSQMKLLIGVQMKLPNSTKDNYLETFIYFSQISQAMAIKAETEYYRQWRSSLDTSGQGLTMGALYWQLNDVWQAPTWSSIDFNKRWKMLHYYAKNFFAPVIVTANVSPARQMTVFVVSDLLTTIRNATVSISIYKWDDLNPIRVQNKTLNILPGYSTTVEQIWLDQYLVDNGCGNLKDAKLVCFIHFSLVDIDGQQIGPENYVFPSSLKSTVGLKTPNLMVKVSTKQTKDTTTKFNLTVSTDTVTPFIWLETPNFNGTFSDNGFIQTSMHKYIEYNIDQLITLKEFQSSLKITSLLSNENL